MNVMTPAAGRAGDDRLDPQQLGPALAESEAIALAAIRDGRIVFANPAFQHLFGAPARLTGTALDEIVADIGDDRLTVALAAAAETPICYVGMGRRGVEAPFYVELKLGTLDIDGPVTLIAFAWDVTTQHSSEQQLAYLAFSDVLTGLPNRAWFNDHLHQELSRRGTFALLMTDLDGFKQINDTLGHEAGDVVLQLVALRLQGSIREGDMVARLGGDEFVVLLPRLSTPNAVLPVCERIMRAMHDPLEVGRHHVNVGISIGIAVYPVHAQSEDGLIAAADAALYRAKQAGKNRIEWATAPTDTEVLPVPPLTWSAVHGVGIAEIDEQHAHIAGLVDAVAAALKSGAGVAAIASLLSQLVSDTKAHFATEERLMAEYGVPSLALHRDVHRHLLDDLTRLGAAPNLGSISLLLRFLQEWLLRHVDSMDRAMARMLRVNGCR
jgi:diguanylate cyclase (GGDEF)-like protein/hemerythrin-like metal-binding protein